MKATRIQRISQTSRKTLPRLVGRYCYLSQVKKSSLAYASKGTTEKFKRDEGNGKGPVPEILPQIRERNNQ
jgi:hypothetical protein